MSRPAILTPEARAELLKAVRRIAEDNEDAARRLRQAVGEAARLIGQRPLAGRAQPLLAPPPYRFWSLLRFRYVLVYEATARPPRIARVLNTAQDLPPLLADLWSPEDGSEQ